MHIVLVPPGTALSNTWQADQVPVGLLLLASILEHSGQARCSLFTGPLWFPDGAEAQAAAILAQRPDLVGFSTWCHTLPAQLSLAHALKAQAPALPILFGGPHASTTDLTLMAAYPCIDLVLRGEAEHSLPALLRSLAGEGPLDQVPGLTWRRAGQPVQNPAPAPQVDLASLPLPAHHLLPPGPQASVESARGCPFSCRFCSANRFFSGRRLRPVAHIVQEILLLQRRGVQHVTFTDDAFSANRSHVEALCQALSALETPLPWSCTTRADLVDPALLTSMASAGCQGVLFGVETGSSRLQPVVAKGLDPQRLIAAVTATLAAGMQAHCSFIFGFPEEGPADLQASLSLVRHLAHLGAQVHAQTLSVLPGTAYHDEQVQHLRYDGFSTLSRADLSPWEEQQVRRHPAIFSSFHYLPTAADRALVLGTAQLTNLLRQLPLTARRAGWLAGADGAPFAWLPQWLADGALSAQDLRLDFDRQVLPLIHAALGPQVANDLALEALFSFETSLFLLRSRQLAAPLPAMPAEQPGHYHCAQDRFFFYSSFDLQALLAGADPTPRDEPFIYLVELDPRGVPRLRAFEPAAFHALQALPDPTTREQALGVLGEMLGAQAAVTLFERCVAWGLLREGRG